MIGSPPRARALTLLSLAAVPLAAALLPVASLVAQVPSPKAFLGHDIGEDYFLADYTQLRSYWAELAKRSQRMVIEQIGTTSYGQPMEIAIISSPANLAKREDYRKLLYRLSRGRDEDPSVVRELARQGKAIIWIDAGMHATESVAAQNIIELTYRMTSRDDAEVREILDNVILLVCPANPDGLEMIAKAYMATKKVGGLPVLYQKYIGHDNNRDHYVATQAETKAIAGALYRRWNPQIVYNHHQSAPRGTIIFTPPFRDPFNFNVDPIVIRGIDLVSAHMNNRFAAEGKAGVISRSGAPYSTWWNGGLRTTVYFHNMIGILTEVYGSPSPGKVTQSLKRRVPYSDYPMPIASQEWHARQTIEYLQTSNFAILELAARYRQEFLHNTWRMARNSIERGERPHWTPTPKLLELAKKHDRQSRGADSEGQNEEDGQRLIPDPFSDPALQDPLVYVMSSDQPDFSAATRFVRALRRTGVEVHRVPRELRTGGKTYPAGSFVVKAAQAFRPHLRDMFEPQWHPDDLGSGGDPVRPYDSSGWTLAMQMGVEFDRLYESVNGGLEAVTDVEVEFLAGSISPGRAGYLMSHSDINGFIVTNRLLASGEEVYWLTEASVGVEVGTVYIRAGDKTVARLAQLSRELGVTFRGVEEKPKGAARRLRPVRVGLFDRFGGNMPTGWAQWAMETFEFPVRRVYGDEINAGDLRDQFDVLLFFTGLPTVGRAARTRQAMRGRRTRAPRGKKDLDRLRSALPAFEDWSDLESRQVSLKEGKAIPALKTFLSGGGVVLAFGSQATTLSKHLKLPVREGVYLDGLDKDGKPRRARSSEYFVPGSLLELSVDVNDPLGYGVAKHQVAMFRRSPVFEVQSHNEGSSTPVTSVAKYVGEGVLASGWAIGEELVAGKSAVLRAEYGEGEVYLFGAEVLYRGQPLGTFKFVFNAILGGTAETVPAVR